MVSVNKCYITRKTFRTARQNAPPRMLKMDFSLGPDPRPDRYSGYGLHIMDIFEIPKYHKNEDGQHEVTKMWKI